MAHKTSLEVAQIHQWIPVMIIDQLIIDATQPAPIERRRQLLLQQMSPLQQLLMRMLSVRGGAGFGDDAGRIFGVGAGRGRVGGVVGARNRPRPARGGSGAGNHVEFVQKFVDLKLEFSQNKFLRKKRVDIGRKR